MSIHSNRYDKLINYAKSQNRSREIGYFEKHHILPRCMGGTNAKSNLVLLTPREHFIAHILLTKIYDHPGLFYAVMLFKKGSHGTYYNARLYEAARLRGLKMSDGHREKLAAAKRGSKGNNRQKWLVTLPSGDRVTVDDRKAFCIENDLNFASIQTLSQRGISNKGYLFVKLPKTASASQ